MRRIRIGACLENACCDVRNIEIIQMYVKKLQFIWGEKMKKGEERMYFKVFVPLREREKELLQDLDL